MQNTKMQTKKRVLVIVNAALIVTDIVWLSNGKKEARVASDHAVVIND